MVCWPKRCRSRVLIFRHTCDFEDLVAWLVTETDKTTVSTFARIAWRTVGAICERVAANVLD